MKTLFLNGLMPERQGQFIRILARHYILSGTRLPDLSDIPDRRILDLYLGQGPDDSALAMGLEKQVHSAASLLARNLEADIAHSPVGPPPGWRVDEQYLRDTLQPKVARLLIQEKRFRSFVQRHPVDMVISGSDYSSHSRPIARAARELGIPTLDLEHGYFFNHIVPEYGRPRGKMPLIFASEYVNLDNQLEVELLEGDTRNFPDQGTRFLGLGTPIDDLLTSGKSRDACLTTLGLSPGKKQILLLGTWCEARNLSRLLTAQVDIMETYQDLFTTLAASDLRDQVQLTIKLHPAEGHPQVFPQVRAALLQIAHSCGLPDPLILDGHLPEALKCADTVLSLGFSSVLYDAFQQGKPTIVVFPPYARYEDKPGWLTRSTLSFQAGVSRGVTDGSGAWTAVQETLDAAWLGTFQKKWDHFADRYGLHPEPVEEKASRLMAWIDERLGVRSG